MCVDIALQVVRCQQKGQGRTQQLLLLFVNEFAVCEEMFYSWFYCQSLVVWQLRNFSNVGVAISHNT